ADGRVLVAAVGPITAGPLRDFGIAPLVPDRGRLGALVRAVVTHYGGPDATCCARASAGSASGRRASCSTASSPPCRAPGSSLLRALARHPGAVVSRADLIAALPNAEASGHAVEVAVARTREALGGIDLIRTVYKRGYRLDIVDEEDA
ncbi:uroporphyrinogen-III synthase, partial [Microbacterium sp. SUBG005]